MAVFAGKVVKGFLNAKWLAEAKTVHCGIGSPPDGLVNLEQLYQACRTHQYSVSKGASHSDMRRIIFCTGTHAQAVI